MADEMFSRDFERVVGLDNVYTPVVPVGLPDGSIVNAPAGFHEATMLAGEIVNPCYFDVVPLSDEPVVILSRWGCKWIKFAFNYIIEGGPADKLARKLLKEYENVHDDPRVYTETHVLTEEKVEIVRDEKTGEQEVKNARRMRRVDKLAKGRRSRFAIAVAKVAYNKFGQRPLSEANLLVTRKWIQKYLDEKFTDLRDCDKNLAIDRALFLSFVPTKDFHKYRMMMMTVEMERRLNGKSAFGRIFRIRSDFPE